MARATYDRLRSRPEAELAAEEVSWLDRYRSLRADQERARRHQQRSAIGQLVVGWLQRVRSLVVRAPTAQMASGPAEQVLEAHARRTAHDLIGHWQSRHQQAALRIPQVFASTPKGVLILAGEPSDVTVAIHRRAERPPKRLFVDLQISLPPGTVATPQAWWWLANSLSLYLGLDPRRTLAAVHRGELAHSRTRSGEPVCDHLHMALPTVQADGSAWRAPHLHAVVQGWLRTAEILAGHDHPAVPAIRGRHVKSLAAGQGFHAVFRRRNKAEDSVTSLQANLVAVAGVERPPPEEMHHRWGVAHVNATVGNARRERMRWAAFRAWAAAGDAVDTLVSATIGAGQAIARYITGRSHPQIQMAVDRLRTADPDHREALELRRYIIGK